MGKISEYILELGETFQDLLWDTGDWNAAKEVLRQQLSPDEYEFFEAHEDIVKTNIEAFDEENERGLQRMDQDNWDEEGNMTFDYDDEPIDEARGGYADVLKPWGGRERNRENINPEDEFDSDDLEPSPEDLNGDVTVSYGERKPYKHLGSEDMYESYKMGSIHENEYFDKLMSDKAEWLDNFKDTLEFDYNMDENSISELIDMYDGLIQDYFQKKEYPSIAAEEIYNGHNYIGESLDESYKMPSLNEEWSFMQDTILTLLIGGLAINYVPKAYNLVKNPEELEKLKTGWKDWINNKLASVSPKYARKKERKDFLENQRLTKENIRNAIEDYGEGKITLDEIEKLVMEDVDVQEAVKHLMYNPMNYQKLYNALKRALKVRGVKGTPIPEIKDRFVRKAKEYQTNREIIIDNVKEELEKFANPEEYYENNLQDIINALQALPEGSEIINVLNKLAAGDLNKKDDFYYFLKKLYKVGLASRTPGPKIVRRLKTEKIQPTDESYKMEGIKSFVNEYYEDEEDDPDVGHTVNGKLLSPEEFRKWKREEGEWGDDPEDHRRRFRR